MKGSITAYPDQEFSIGPGKCLSSREKYEDKTERLFTVSCRAGNYRLRPESKGFCIHKGNGFTNNPSVGSFFDEGGTRPYSWQHARIHPPSQATNALFQQTPLNWRDRCRARRQVFLAEMQSPSKARAHMFRAAMALPWATRVAATYG